MRDFVVLIITLMYPMMYLIEDGYCSSLHRLSDIKEDNNVQRSLNLNTTNITQPQILTNISSENATFPTPVSKEFKGQKEVNKTVNPMPENLENNYTVNNSTETPNKFYISDGVYILTANSTDSKGKSLSRSYPRPVEKAQSSRILENKDESDVIRIVQSSNSNWSLKIPTDKKNKISQTKIADKIILPPLLKRKSNIYESSGENVTTKFQENISRDTHTSSRKSQENITINANQSLTKSQENEMTINTLPSPTKLQEKILNINTSLFVENKTSFAKEKQLSSSNDLIRIKKHTGYPPLHQYYPPKEEYIIPGIKPVYKPQPNPQFGSPNTVPGIYYQMHNPTTGEYKFKYNAGTHWREEESSQGVVYGSYGWTDSTGRIHSTRYISDAAGHRVIQPGSSVPTFALPPPPKKEENSWLNFDTEDYNEQISSHSEDNHHHPIDKVKDKHENEFEFDGIDKIPSSIFEMPATGRPPIAYPLPHKNDSPKPILPWNNSEQNLIVDNNSIIGSTYPSNSIHENKSQNHPNYASTVPTFTPQIGYTQHPNYIPGHVYSYVYPNSIHNYPYNQVFHPQSPFNYDYTNWGNDLNYPYGSDSRPLYFDNQSPYQQVLPQGYPGINNNYINSIHPLTQPTYYPSPAINKPQEFNTDNYFSQNNNIYEPGTPSYNDKKQLLEKILSQSDFMNIFLNVLNSRNLTITKKPTLPMRPEFQVPGLQPWTSSVIKLPQRPNDPIPIPSQDFDDTSLDYALLEEDFESREEEYSNNSQQPNSIQDIINNILNDISTKSPVVKPHPLKPSRLGEHHYLNDNYADITGTLKAKLPVLNRHEKPSTLHNLQYNSNRYKLPSPPIWKAESLYKPNFPSKPIFTDNLKGDITTKYKNLLNTETLIRNESTTESSILNIITSLPVPKSTLPPVLQSTTTQAPDTTTPSVQEHTTSVIFKSSSPPVKMSIEDFFKNIIMSISNSPLNNQKDATVVS